MVSSMECLAALVCENLIGGSFVRARARVLLSNEQYTSVATYVVVKHRRVTAKPVLSTLKPIIMFFRGIIGR